jgi:hypothetical protein
MIGGQSWYKAPFKNYAQFQVSVDTLQPQRSKEWAALEGQFLREATRALPRTAPLLRAMDVDSLALTPFSIGSYTVTISGGTNMMSSVDGACAFCSAADAGCSCSRCATRYCSRACQKKHWSVHKPVCAPPSYPPEALSLGPFSDEQSAGAAASKLFSEMSQRAQEAEAAGSL